MLWERRLTRFVPLLEQEQQWGRNTQIDVRSAASASAASGVSGCGPLPSGLGSQHCTRPDRLSTWGVSEVFSFQYFSI